MRPNSDSFSLVLLGAWNPSIFRERWILQNLLEEGQAEFSIAFPASDPTGPRRISFQEIHLYPGRRQLTVQSATCTLQGMQRCAELAVRTLGLLPHTPVGACGLNFGFIENNRIGGLFELLDLNDRAQIDRETYRLEETSVTRRFRLGDNLAMNLTLSDTEGRGMLSFNYHHEHNDVNAYRQLLTPAYIEERYQQTLTFCQTVYSLTLEEDAE